jgi:hypothetical protein
MNWMTNRARGRENVARTRAVKSRFIFSAMIFVAVASAPDISKADEGGVSFWIPGFFGSLAAAPQQPGWSLTNIAYQTSVSADAGVAIARERSLATFPPISICPQTSLPA